MTELLLVAGVVFAVSVLIALLRPLPPRGIRTITATRENVLAPMVEAERRYFNLTPKEALEKVLERQVYLGTMTVEEATSALQTGLDSMATANTSESGSASTENGGVAE